MTERLRGEGMIEEHEKQHFAELSSRYDKLYSWAKDQEFTTVYRVEGDPSWKVDRSLSPELVGTWYTEHFSLIPNMKSNIEGMSGMPARVFSLIIPKSLLEGRDTLAKGMSEVNVLNPDLLAGRKEITNPDDALPPTLENYLDQFAFVREYRELKERFGD